MFAGVNAKRGKIFLENRVSNSAVAALSANLHTCSSNSARVPTIKLAKRGERRHLTITDASRLRGFGHARKIKLLPVKHARPACPLSREEQAALLQELPEHLARMSLLKVNTGTREQELCGLKWADEFQVPELDMSVFIIEGDKVKKEQDRLIVLRRTLGGRQRQGSAREVRLRAKPVPLDSMNTTAWKSARNHLVAAKAK